MNRVRELDIIRGKLLVKHATSEDINKFLVYVLQLEALLEDADLVDFYGTEGWRHRIGLD